MRVKKKYIIITFHTTTAAMAMEKLCGQRGIPGRLIPVPESISAGCGLAWRILPEEYEQFQSQIEDLGLEFQQIGEAII